MHYLFLIDLVEQNDRRAAHLQAGERLYFGAFDQSNLILVFLSKHAIELSELVLASVYPKQMYFVGGDPGL